MTTDLFTDTPEVAALKAENKLLRQHLKCCIREIQVVRIPVSKAYEAVDAMGGASIAADLYLREVSHDSN